MKPTCLGAGKGGILLHLFVLVVSNEKVWTTGPLHMLSRDNIDVSSISCHSQTRMRHLFRHVEPPSPCITGKIEHVNTRMRQRQREMIKDGPLAYDVRIRSPQSSLLPHCLLLEFQAVQCYRWIWWPSDK